MNEQRARDAVEHLQTAAIEVIESVRALLDLAEDLIRDPAPLTSAINDLADVGRHVARQQRDEGDDGGVTRIRVS